MLVVFAIGALAFLVGSTFILMAAFRKRLWWGLGVLLVPSCAGLLGVLLPAQGISITGWVLPALLVPLIIVIIFVVLHWHQAYLGVFVALTGMMLAVGGVLGGADRQLQKYLDRAGIDEVSVEVPVQRPEDIVVPNAQQIAASGLDQTNPNDQGGYTLFKVEPLAPRDSIRLPRRTVVERAYRPTPLDQDLNAFAGMNAKIFTHDGQMREGRLVESQTSGVFLEAAVAGGRVTYEFRLEDVARLEVLRAASSAIDAQPVQRGNANAMIGHESAEAELQESPASTAPMSALPSDVAAGSPVQAPEIGSAVPFGAVQPSNEHSHRALPEAQVPAASGLAPSSGEQPDPETTWQHQPTADPETLQDVGSGHPSESAAPSTSARVKQASDESVVESRPEQGETFVSSD